jgi:hypothetical protein
MYRQHTFTFGVSETVISVLTQIACCAPQWNCKMKTRSCLICIASLSTCSGLRAPLSLSASEKHEKHQVSRRAVLSTSGAAVAASIAATQLPSQSKAAAGVAAALPAEAYALIGGEMKSCKVLNGMWQLSGAHGFNPQLDPALNAMQKLASAGFTTFDLVCSP